MEKIKNSGPEVKHSNKGVALFLKIPKIYNSWQLLSGAEKAKKVFFLEHIKPFENCRILDIGCGTGIALDYIDVRCQYVGLDINQDYINSAKKKYKQRGSFYCSSVEGFKWSEKKFDIVIGLGILHHLSDVDSIKLINIARENLVESGIFILVEPVWHKDQSFIEKLLMRLDRGKNIREEHEYLQLLGKNFKKNESKIYTGLLNIPWTLAIMKGYR